MTRHAHRRRRRSLLGALTIAACALSGAAGPDARVRAQEVTASPLDLLQYYALGQHAEVERALAQAARGDLGVVLEGLRGSADQWIAADGRAFAEHRRAVVATFALEVASSALEHQWTRSKDMLEWMCARLRKEPQPSAWERAWQLAALALFEGSRDRAALSAHLEHLRARFPDEPRVSLARAFLVETAFWDELAATPPGYDDPSPGAAMSALEPLLARPDVRNEAAVRLGYFTWRMQQFDQALLHLAPIKAPDDPGQEYLRQLFLGWVHEGKGRNDDAIRAFRAACDAIPGAQSATMFLAVRLNIAGRRDEAKQVVEAALAANPPPFDPWRNFGYGDLRRFPMLLGQLRKVIP